MMTEIKRNTWARFCKRFNQGNQYRPVSICVKRSGEEETRIDQNTPFMGVMLAKKGRFIDGVEFFAANPDPERLTRPIVSIKQPAKMMLEKDADGADCCLIVEGKDGVIARMVLSGRKNLQQRHSLVEKVAYSIYERRGCAPGNPVEDWLEAERKVQEAELSFVH
jgi:hypothetical protein